MVKPRPQTRTNGSRKQEIIGSAIRVLCRESLTRWSIDGVSREARCAKGLVIHYFRGRDQLLSAIGTALATDREKRWLGALTGNGIADLDALWATLLQATVDGTARALLELRLAGTSTASLPPTAASQLRTALARTLETTPGELPVAGALEGIFEGYLLALLSGTEEAPVREAFFRYWLTYVG